MFKLLQLPLNVVHSLSIMFIETLPQIVYDETEQKLFMQAIMDLIMPAILLPRVLRL